MDIEFTKLDELTFNLEEKMGSPAIMTAKQAEYLCSYFLLKKTRHMPGTLPQPIRVADVTGWIMTICCLSQSELRSLVFDSG